MHLHVSTGKRGIGRQFNASAKNVLLGSRFIGLPVEQSELLKQIYDREEKRDLHRTDQREHARKAAREGRKLYRTTATSRQNSPIQDTAKRSMTPAGGPERSARGQRRPATSWSGMSKRDAAILSARSGSSSRRSKKLNSAKRKRAMKIAKQLQQLEAKMSNLRQVQARRDGAPRTPDTAARHLHGGEVAPVKLYDSEPAKGLLPAGVPFKWSVSKASCTMSDYTHRRQHPHLTLDQPSKSMFTSGHIEITSPAYQARGHLVSEFDNAHAPFASNLRFTKAPTKQPVGNPYSNLV